MSAGVSVARALAGSWRDPPPTAGPDAARIAEVEEQLIRSGGGGLVWWRIRADPALSDSPIGKRFHEAFKLNSVYASMHRDQISRVLKGLRDSGLEPILFKGWDCARTYPHEGMRPYGDIDLCLLPQDVEKARSTLAGSPDESAVDLEHDEIEAAWIPGIVERSESVPLGDTAVRVMGPEDRLRTLALHALKGEVWGPRSLCDVALAVESRPDEFDWGVCLTDDPVVHDWVLTAISLAGKLLGADLGGVPTKTPPRWMVRRTLGMWSAPWPAKHGVELAPLPNARHPLVLLSAMAERWPGPVQATVSGRARFGNAPRLPLQLLDVLRRTLDYMARRATR